MDSQGEDFHCEVFIDFSNSYLNVSQSQEFYIKMTSIRGFSTRVKKYSTPQSKLYRLQVC